MPKFLTSVMIAVAALCADIAGAQGEATDPGITRGEGADPGITRGAGAVKVMRVDGTGVVLGIDIRAVPDWLADQLSLERGKAGVMVQRVEPGSCAMKHGLRVGDILLKLDGQGLMDEVDLIRRLRARPANKELSLEFMRAGKVETLKFVPQPAAVKERQEENLDEWIELEVRQSVNRLTPEQQLARQKHLEKVLNALADEQRLRTGKVPPTCVEMDDIGPIILQMREGRPYVYLFAFGQSKPVGEGFVDNEIDWLKLPPLHRQRIERKHFRYLPRTGDQPPERAQESR